MWDHRCFSAAFWSHLPLHVRNLCEQNSKVSMYSDDRSSHLQLILHCFCVPHVFVILSRVISGDHYIGDDLFRYLAVDDGLYNRRTVLY